MAASNALSDCGDQLRDFANRFRSQLRLEFDPPFNFANALRQYPAHASSLSFFIALHALENSPRIDSVPARQRTYSQDQFGNAQSFALADSMHREACECGGQH